MTRPGILIAIVCMTLAVLAALPWRTINGGETISVASTRASVPSARSTAAILDLPPLSSYSVTVERPLFAASRRRANQTPEMGEKDLLLGRYRVSGIVIAGDRRIVLIEPVDGDKVRSIQQGEELEGWTLAKIDTGTLVLEREGERRTIDLHRSASGTE